jgi:hypothetical protein
MIVPAAPLSTDIAPYSPGQAHGLCFSVQAGVRPPPSLVNMYKELEASIPGFKRPTHGNLGEITAQTHRQTYRWVARVADRQTGAVRLPGGEAEPIVCMASHTTHNTGPERGWGHRLRAAGGGRGAGGNHGGAVCGGVAEHWAKQGVFLLNASLTVMAPPLAFALFHLPCLHHPRATL